MSEQDRGTPVREQENGRQGQERRKLAVSMWGQGVDEGQHITHLEETKVVVRDLPEWEDPWVEIIPGQGKNETSLH